MPEVALQAGTIAYQDTGGGGHGRLALADQRARQGLPPKEELAIDHSTGSRSSLSSAPRRSEPVHHRIPTFRRPRRRLHEPTGEPR
jgi:hypothetical protein